MKLILLAVLAMTGCATAPHGAVMWQDRQGGTIALFSGDADDADAEPGITIARVNAERQMIEHCDPLDYEIVSVKRPVTRWRATDYEYGRVGHVALTQLSYVCKTLDHCAHERLRLHTIWGAPTVDEKLLPVECRTVKP